MAPPDQKDLESLALQLAKTGPVKTLETPRRVRIFFKGACVADTSGTSGAVYVWEHPHYPQFYLPRAAFDGGSGGRGVEYKRGEAVRDEQGGRDVATRIEITVSGSEQEEEGKSTIQDSIVEFAKDLEGPGKVLSGLIKVKFDAVDKWIEEDTPIFSHPKDPFKRIDVLSSLRPLRVSLNNRVVAESASSMHLYETSLPARFYIPLTAIDASVLRPSKTRTQCPYKGEAEYYSVVVGGNEYKDVVWFYNRPTVECAAVTGLCCFYNEKVDIEMQEKDGWKKLERPKTLFG